MSASGTGWLRSLPDAAIVGAATLGPIGRLPAPGTWGSLAGLAWVALVWMTGLHPVLGAIAVLALLLLAVAFCGEAEIRLGRRDPGMVILDEFAAMPLCFVGWNQLVAAWPAWAVLLAGFGAFRLFDIAKPLGIRRLQELPGGWGVVVDDAVAALAACGLLHLVRVLWT